MAALVIGEKYEHQRTGPDGTELAHRDAEVSIGVCQCASTILAEKGDRRAMKLKIEHHSHDGELEGPTPAKLEVWKERQRSQ